MWKPLWNFNTSRLSCSTSACVQHKSQCCWLFIRWFFPDLCPFGWREEEQWGATLWAGKGNRGAENKAERLYQWGQRSTCVHASNPQWNVCCVMSVRYISVFPGLSSGVGCTTTGEQREGGAWGCTVMWTTLLPSGRRAPSDPQSTGTDTGGGREAERQTA